MSPPATRTTLLALLAAVVLGAVPASAEPAGPSLASSQAVVDVGQSYRLTAKAAPAPP